MTEQTFKVAGITTQNGNSKVRFTDDLIRRVKIFNKLGATRIDLVELPSEMTKIEALRYLMTAAEFQSPGDQATITDAIQNREGASPKTEIKVKASQAPSLDAIKARAKAAVTASDLHNVDPA
jgi:hypothetical protein